MKEDLPMSETVKISITSTPSPKVVQTAYPMPGLSLKAEIEAFLETQMVVSKAKPQDENAERPSHRYGMNDGSASFGLFKDKK
jgi:hypothetical protein